MKKRIVTCVLIIVGFVLWVSYPDQEISDGSVFDSNPAQTAKTRVIATYGKIPMHFEANQGQADDKVKFLSRGGGYTLFLTSNEAVLSLRKPEIEERESGLKLPTEKITSENPESETYTPFDDSISNGASSKSTVLRMQLVGANSEPRVTGLEELPGKSNYFIGNDPQKWRTAVPNFTKVHYEDIYPGVDLIYYGNQRQLEYDFIVAPGADPQVINLGFKGADYLEIDPQGNLALYTAGGIIYLKKPFIYQEPDGTKQAIAGHYVMHGKYQVGFQVGMYDTSSPLIIDPVINYSTFLGGNGTDEGYDIAVDASGNAYVTGMTSSNDFPTTAGAFDTVGGSFSDPSDVFVTKINPSGTALVYSTYLSGSEADVGYGIAVDASGNAYVVGETQSFDDPNTAVNEGFPLMNPLQPNFGGTSDLFVTKLDPTGSALVYSTYLGGTGSDRGHGIVVDGDGNVYLTGSTRSTNFPTVSPIQGTLNGTENAIIVKIDASGGSLVYSTYLGGGFVDRGWDIAIDPSGNAYISGQAFSDDFPTVSPIDGTLGGSFDAIVAKINATGTILVYSTYLGGSGIDVGNDIAVDSSGNAYVTGETFSSDFPLTNPIDGTKGIGSDAFVT
ncbi:SBBP repeat-containing protein, partial [candidate division KSB1 bacterium]|nr:SBBP repeat-containing protein [candidate division KSB1 bacterium]